MLLSPATQPSNVYESAPPASSSLTLDVAFDGTEELPQQGTRLEERQDRQLAEGLPFFADSQAAVPSWHDFNLSDLDLSWIFSDDIIPTQPVEAMRARAPTTMIGNTGHEYCFSVQGVEKLWYTELNSEPVDTAPSSPRIGSETSTYALGQSRKTDITENHRINLSRRLRLRFAEEPLPSTEFLVREVLPSLDFS